MLNHAGFVIYTLSLHNTGQADLSDLTITEIMTLPGQAPQQVAILTQSSLAAGQTLDVEHTRSVPNEPGKTMTLLVTAIAIGADGGQVQATVTENLLIQTVIE